jgi:hypothetical protein
MSTGRAFLYHGQLNRPAHLFNTDIFKNLKVGIDSRLLCLYKLRDKKKEKFFEQKK